MVTSAKELQLGVFRFLQTTNKMRSQSLCSVSHFTLRLQYIRTWGITVILIMGKTQILKLEPQPPCQDNDGIADLYLFVRLWVHTKIRKVEVKTDEDTVKKGEDSAQDEVSTGDRKDESEAQMTRTQQKSWGRHRRRWGTVISFIITKTTRPSHLYGIFIRFQCVLWIKGIDMCTCKENSVHVCVGDTENDVHKYYYTHWKRLCNLFLVPNYCYNYFFFFFLHFVYRKERVMIFPISSSVGKSWNYQESSLAGKKNIVQN